MKGSYLRGFSPKLFHDSFFFPQAGRPRRRNASASGLISLRSITPAKAACAATDIFFF